MHRSPRRQKLQRGEEKRCQQDDQTPGQTNGLAPRINVAFNDCLPPIKGKAGGSDHPRKRRPDGP